MDYHDVALQIDQIRRVNSNSLSFIPLSTIENRYLVKDRVCLIFDGDIVLAYLLHGSMKRDKHVCLTQVATKPEYNLGLQVFRMFKKKAFDFGCSAITVRCAEDVRANWRALGFCLLDCLDVGNTRNRKICLWHLDL